MAIDTSGLNGWPSPAQLQAGARTLRDVGPQLEDAIEDVSSIWNGLQAAYEAPEADRVYDVFRDITPHGSFVSAASQQAAKALETFADGIAALEGSRATALADAAAHDSFVNSPACTEEDESQARAAGGLLQGRINLLAAEILQLEQDCVNALGEATGETNAFFAAAASNQGSLVANTVDTLRNGVRSRGDHSAGGPRTYYDLRPEINQDRYNRSPRYKNFVDTNPNRFAVAPPEFADASRAAKVARAGGPVLTVVGAGLTFGNERQDEMNRLREANPGMSQADIAGQANEKAAFRTGTSVLAGVGAGYAGAAVGTMIGGPVGTVLGFGIGMMISFAADQELDILGGRSITQWAGDGLRSGWNAITENEHVQRAGAALGKAAEDARESVKNAIGDAGAALFGRVFGR